MSLGAQGGRSLWPLTNSVRSDEWRLGWNHVTSSISRAWSQLCCIEPWLSAISLMHDTVNSSYALISEYLSLPRLWRKKKGERKRYLNCSHLSSRACVCVAVWFPSFSVAWCFRLEWGLLVICKSHQWAPLRVLHKRISCNVAQAEII